MSTFLFDFENVVVLRAFLKMVFKIRILHDFLRRFCGDCFLVTKENDSGIRN